MSTSSSNPNETTDESAGGGGGLFAHRERVQASLANLGKTSLSTLGDYTTQIGQALQKKINNSTKPAATEGAQDFRKVVQNAKEENERQKMVDEALAKCKATMEDHLHDFLFLHPQATYEEWVQDLHPENVADGKLLADFKDVDLRFYVHDSDHRILWNQHAPPHRQVAARTTRQPGQHVVDAPTDLLNDLFSQEGTAPAYIPNVDDDNNNNMDAPNKEEPLIDLLGDGWP